MLSVIIPYYNEEKTLRSCIESLSKQSYKSFELILVDDGSTDNPIIPKDKKIMLLRQTHAGAARARNFGASNAKGDIFVFVDADMTFAGNFLEKLIAPILAKKCKGTFTKEEYVSNWDNIWARCFNYNQGLNGKMRVPGNHPDEANVFRAIKRTEFERVGGFDETGFTDDWSLTKKLGYKASKADGAICYHKNPDTLADVYRQARWIGGNEFLTRNIFRKLYNLLRFCPPVQFVRSIIVSIRYQEPRFVLFNLVYSIGIYKSLVESFWKRRLYK